MTKDERITKIRDLTASHKLFWKRTSENIYECSDIPYFLMIYDASFAKEYPLSNMTSHGKLSLFTFVARYGNALFHEYILFGASLPDLIKRLSDKDSEQFAEDFDLALKVFVT